MKLSLKESFGIALRLLVPWFLLFVHAGCAPSPADTSELDALQGSWEGEEPPGKISLTITDNTLRFYARADFWYETTFTLPSGTEPKQLNATITDSSPPTKDIGAVVFAIFKIEDGRLTFAVDDGSSEPPTSFPDALSRFTFKRIQTREEDTEAPARDDDLHGPH